MNCPFFCPPPKGGPHTSKSKRAKNSPHKQKAVVVLYDKLCEIVSSISELLEIQLLTDTTILQVPLLRIQFQILDLRFLFKCQTTLLSDLQVSTLGITPFFVENVCELQLCAITLVTAVSSGLID